MITPLASQGDFCASAKDLLAVLARAGQASSMTFKAANGKRIEIWTATP
jgi:hypothetical protein